MERTVVGLFRDSNEARAALHDLQSSGFTHQHLNVVTYDGSQENSGIENPGSELGSNTTKGAAAGGVAGLLLGLAAVAIPGVGPIIAAGPIAAALAGAGVGVATGGMLGALVDMGVPGHEAKYYEEAVRGGGTLVIVRSEGEKAEDAQSILDRHGALDLHEDPSAARTEGWKPDDPHSDAANFGDEGGSSQWSHNALTDSERKRKARVYPDKRRP